FSVPITGPISMGWWQCQPGIIADEGVVARKMPRVSRDAARPCGELLRQDLQRVPGPSLGQVLDLVPARRARRDDRRLGVLLEGGQQIEIGDGHAEVEVL